MKYQDKIYFWGQKDVDSQTLKVKTLFKTYFFVFQLFQLFFLKRGKMMQSSLVCADGINVLLSFRIHKIVYFGSLCLPPLLCLSLCAFLKYVCVPSCLTLSLSYCFLSVIRCCKKRPLSYSK